MNTLRKLIAQYLPQNVIEGASQQEIAQLVPNQNLKILIVGTAKSGVHYHRLISPFKNLSDNIDFGVIVTEGLEEFIHTFVDFETQIKAVVFSRSISTLIPNEDFINAIKEHGIKVICDIDDYWVLNKEHVLYGKFFESADGNITMSQIRSLKNADEVWVTNYRLKEKVSVYNGNTHIIENAINVSDEQWRVNKRVPSNVAVFGYAGSPTHKHDVKPLFHAFRHLYSSGVKFFTVLGGNPYQKHMEETGGRMTEGLSVYLDYIKTFTGRTDFSKRDNFKTFPYLETNEYGKFYNEVNTFLIPIADNEFNVHKSHLKMIESAAMNCLMIVSKREPYLEYFDESIALWVDGDYNWGKVMERVCRDRESYDDRVINARRWMMDNFSMDVINKKRIERLYANSIL